MGRKWLLVAGALLVLPVGANAQQNTRDVRDRVRERPERPVPTAQDRCVDPDRMQGARGRRSDVADRRVAGQRDRTGPRDRTAQRAGAGGRAGQARPSAARSRSARGQRPRAGGRPAAQDRATTRPRPQARPRPGAGQTTDRARPGAEQRTDRTRPDPEQRGGRARPGRTDTESGRPALRERPPCGRSETPGGTGSHGR